MAKFAIIPTLILSHLLHILDETHWVFLAKQIAGKFIKYTSIPPSLWKKPTPSFKSNFLIPFPFAGFKKPPVFQPPPILTHTHTHTHTHTQLLSHLPGATLETMNERMFTLFWTKFGIKFQLISAKQVRHFLVSWELNLLNCVFRSCWRYMM